MSDQLIARQSIIIDADIETVWDALTNPEQIAKYFFGTNAESTWELGAEITFTGTWEGKEYVDKGFIKQIDEPYMLQYSYWSSMSGTDDDEENYGLVTYELEETEEGTMLTVTQSGFDDEEQHSHSEENWAEVLDNIQSLLENEE